jgi:hypothetical protein
MRHFLSLLVFASALLPLGLAQTITGTLSGTVADDTAAVIPGAAVVLLNERTGEQRRTISNTSGDFTFPAVPPDTYTVKIDRPGFRGLERTGIVLTSTQRLSLGVMKLQVGELTQSVTVSQRGEIVNTENAQNSALLSATQLDLTQARGRDVINILKILPGVSQMMQNSGGSEVDETDPINGNQASGSWGSLTPNISGTRSWMNNAMLDGLAANDTGWVGSYQGILPMEAIAEVKVVLNNYQAEYGRNGGGTINIVSKGGTKEFHGNAYFFKRHEKFNSNNFFSNRTGIPRPVYRYSNFGGVISGPVYIPGKFNKNRDKLFFMFLHEEWQIKQPAGIARYTLPSELERRGDFSQTLDQNGRLVPITDPTTGRPFPGNVIPTDRISRHGQSLLNLLPLPNRLDRDITRGAFNFEFEDSYEIPKRIQHLTLDYNPTDRDRITIRPRRWWSDTRGYTIGVAGLGGVPLVRDRAHYLFSESSVNISHTRMLSASTVNEVQGGFRRTREFTFKRNPHAFDSVIRSNVGITLGQFYPQNNPLNLIPEASYGGIPAAPSYQFDGRTPQNGPDTRVTLLDNLTWTRASHTIKLGLYLERNYRGEGYRSGGSFTGRFDFARDTNNPGDAGWPFATALLGNFRSYIESTSKTRDLWETMLGEWFIQDTWKAMRRLTLTYGVRFSKSTPWSPSGPGVGAAFAPDRYDLAKAPVFFRPVLDASGRRVGQNPLTGELVPAVLIGTFVPGVGDPANGMVLYNDPNYPSGFMNRRPIQVQPRFGFAYDVFGDGKMAVRGGVGVNKQTVQSSSYVPAFVTAPPLQFSPQIYYGNIDMLSQAAAGVLSASNVQGVERINKAPTIYNYSLGIQRQIGFSTLLDVSYVGNVARHLVQSRNQNTIPYGARFLPQNVDPTTGRALPDNFFRRYMGYGNVSILEYSGISNYNALQSSLTRRFTQGVQFGVAYTWSKAMDLTSAELGGLPLYVSDRVWAYGKATFDQTHMFIVNYTWELPKLTSLWNRPLIKWVFDNWQVSGITSFASGQPRGIGFTTTDGADIAGGGDGERVIVTRKAALPHGERSFSRWFDTGAFARPPQGTFGNAPKDVYRGPGINNWDITFLKDFPLKSETRKLQYRLELYNAFNHTQFRAIDSTARFDPLGNQVNGQFGQATASRPPRLMQMALKFYF